MRAKWGLSQIHQPLDQANFREDEDVARAGGLAEHQGIRINIQTSYNHLRDLTCRSQGLYSTHSHDHGWLRSTHSHDHGVCEILLCSSHTIIPTDNAWERLHGETRV